MYGPNGGVLVRAPGRPKSWIELLPHPWSSDPFIVLVLVPEEAKTFIKVDKEGTHAFGVMELDGKEEGLQILKPDIKKWSEQAYTFAKAGIKIRRPDFVGRMSAIPQGYLMTGHHPIVYLRDDMTHEFFNVRAFARPSGSLERRKEFWS